MWKIYRATDRVKSGLILGVGLLCLTGSIAAQAQTSNRQSHGFYLPSAPRSNGFDEVRTSDGTTCRSSMSGNGAYLDLGGITAQGQEGFDDSVTAYGRVIIPLGKKPGRIDCRSLYQLEIERLKMELQAAKAGLGNNAGSANVKWNNE